MLDKDKLLDLLVEADEQSRLMFSMSGRPVIGAVEDVEAMNIRYSLWMVGLVDKLPNPNDYDIEFAEIR